MYDRILRLNGDEMEEVDIEALVSDQQTFHTSNVTGGNIVQVCVLCVECCVCGVCVDE